MNREDLATLELLEREATAGQWRWLHTTNADCELLVALRNNAAYLIACARFVEEHGEELRLALDVDEPFPGQVRALAALSKLRSR